MPLDPIVPPIQALQVKSALFGLGGAEPAAEAGPAVPPIQAWRDQLHADIAANTGGGGRSLMSLIRRPKPRLAAPPVDPASTPNRRPGSVLLGGFFSRLLGGSPKKTPDIRLPSPETPDGLV